jgi:hypothetical protein
VKCFSAIESLSKPAALRSQVTLDVQAKKSFAQSLVLRQRRIMANQRFQGDFL